MATTLDKIIPYLLTNGPSSAKRITNALDLNGSTVRVILRRAVDDEDSPVTDEDGVYTLAWHPESREPLKAALVTSKEGRMLELWREEK
ncbi:MAG: hypothetical protein CMH57_02595 [Myxococcales bacterium]|nr:hypothetical protein [Myxococcales bacterium]